MALDKNVSDFIAGLEGLAIGGVTMLGSEPAAPPADDALPVAWVKWPTIVGRPPATAAVNSAIRKTFFQAVLVVAYAFARPGELDDHFDALMTLGLAVQDALDTADIGFRLNYEIAIDKRVKAGGESFYGVAAVVATGER